MSKKLFLFLVVSCLFSNAAWLGAMDGNDSIVEEFSSAQQDNERMSTEPKEENKEQDKKEDGSDSIAVAAAAVLLAQQNNDQITQKELDAIKANPQEIFKLFGVSFDKTKLIYCGAGAVAIITVCGVTYVLYKNGTLKKIGNFVKDHKIGVGAALTSVVTLVVAGVYAKQKGLTVAQAGTWFMNLFGEKPEISETRYFD